MITLSLSEHLSRHFPSHYVVNVPRISMFKTAPSLFLQKWTSLLFTKTVSTLCSGGIGSQFGEKFGLLVFVQCTLYNVCLCVQLHIHCNTTESSFVFTSVDCCKVTNCTIIAKSDCNRIHIWTTQHLSQAANRTESGFNSFLYFSFLFKWKKSFRNLTIHLFMQWLLIYQGWVGNILHFWDFLLRLGKILFYQQQHWSELAWKLCH